MKPKKITTDNLEIGDIVALGNSRYLVLDKKTLRTENDLGFGPIGIELTFLSLKTKVKHRPIYQGDEVFDLLYKGSE